MSAGWFRYAVLCVLVACGSSSPPPPEPVVKAAPPKRESAAERERRERAQKDTIVARHRQLESASQDALAESCDDLEAWAKQHCSPSCYPPEVKDTRAGTKLAGPVEIQHRVCQRAIDGGEHGPLLVMDGVDDTQLVARKHKGRFPKPHGKTSWQAEIATWFVEAQPKKKARGDVVIINDKWKDVRHPLTHEAMRCVTISRFTRSLRGKLDACGGGPRTACEAGGNAAVRGLNLVHFRVAEAKQLQATGNDTACMTAAQEAIAIARGLPRWRQYQKLNIDNWTDGLSYKTRFDGVLDEDQLFETATALGAEAQSVYAACGGPPNAPTKVVQEQSFHACPKPATP